MEKSLGDGRVSGAGLSVGNGNGNDGRSGERGTKTSGRQVALVTGYGCGWGIPSKGVRVAGKRGVHW
jgi:hypothetical protein